MSPPTVPGGVWTQTILCDFTENIDEDEPLLLDLQGNLYAESTAQQSGLSTIFELRLPAT